MASSRGDLSSSSSASSSLEELSQPSRSSVTSSSRENIIDTTRSDNQGSEMKKTNEGNPFSFKHFLRKASSSSSSSISSQTNYRNSGARPKVYSDSGNTGKSSVDNDSVYVARNPTELPDFVQDHLVIEQCYLNSNNNDGNNDGAVSPSCIPDIDNLPDFALNSIPRAHRIDDNENVTNSQQYDNLPNDLTGHRGRRPVGTIERQHNGFSDNLETIGSFPLDLPVQATNDRDLNLQDRDRLPSRDNNIPKSLPDFLSDGPILNRVVVPQQESSISSSSLSTTASTAILNSSVPAERLLVEIEQLRHNYDLARRQNHEQYRRIQMLEGELSTRRAVDNQETAHLEKAMEQVEDNLKRSTRRAVNAESAVTTLKQEVKTLKLKISVLQNENDELKNSLGARYNEMNVGSNNEKKIKQFASDIRNAASSAEYLLRQLMTGVNNLNVIASTMENADRIEDRTKDYLFDLNDDDDDGNDDAAAAAAGPAL